MKPKEFLVSVLEMRKSTRNAAFPCTTYLLFILAISACSPAVKPTEPKEIQATVEATATPVKVTSAPTVEITEPATATAAPELIYPVYLPLATKPDVAPQTIDGVTVAIDWAYVDEARVAVQYTISGLDWADGSMLDGMQQVQMSIPALSNFKSGGFSGGGSGNNNFAQKGVITASSDQALLVGALDAEKYPEINVKVAIPVEGPTKIGTFHFSLTVPVADGTKIENIDQTMVSNNISMTLKSLSLNPSHAEALICFQMPSAVDWGLIASKLTVGGREYPISDAGIASAKDDPSSAVTALERCNNVGFDAPYDRNSDASITLTVPKLMASVNEVVTQDVIDRANQRLAEKGIEFDYASIDHGGNIVVLKRPDGATDEQVYPLIWDAMAEQYEGPWVFTVEIPT